MMRLFPLFTAVLGIWLASSPAFAAGKKRPSEAPAPAPTEIGKRVIEIIDVPQVEIEFPDGSKHSFGQDFKAALKGDLERSGRYVVTFPEEQPLSPFSAKLKHQPGDVCASYCWDSSQPAAATLKIDVDAMSFQTGSRGEKTLYGFTERFRTPFNDGSERQVNEFPLRTTSFDPNWFDRTFDDKGSAPFDSRSGLDLGDGFRLDALFAWLSVKYAKYDARLRLRLALDSSVAERHELREVSVQGGGYFFDVSGGYEIYSGGIALARSDAMGQAFRRAISATYDSVARALEGLPLAARVDWVYPSGVILLGTGNNAGVLPGTYYQPLEHPEIVLQVMESVADGSVARLVRGELSGISVGDLLKSIPSLPQAAPEPAPKARVQALRSVQGGRALVASEEIVLPPKNLPRPPALDGWVPNDNVVNAFLKSLAGTLTLPYRILRYFSYDQAFHKEADQPQSDPAPGPEGSIGVWLERARSASWAAQIGLSGASDPALDPSIAPVVAIVDTGVDYNHPAIHDSLWLNPSPQRSGDGLQDRYGFDFVSGDSRPYDDGYHGTEMASAVVAVAPGAKIMALKAFSPYGITSSAALYAAIQYATDHGADVILCAWATRRDSQAIEQAVKYATDRGSVVVAAAGDRGDDLGNFPAYPASLAASSDRVLAVTDVDAQDRLVREPGKFSNFGGGVVGIAAPGVGVELANPRASYDHVTSSSVSAALTAGAIARELGLMRLSHAEAFAPDALQAVLASAERVSGLASAVSGGRRLRIPR